MADTVRRLPDGSLIDMGEVEGVLRRIGIPDTPDFGDGGDPPPREPYDIDRDDGDDDYSDAPGSLVLARQALSIGEALCGLICAKDADPYAAIDLTREWGRAKDAYIEMMLYPATRNPDVRVRFIPHTPDGSDPDDDIKIGGTD